jgi:3-methyladenine DNA glycosylase Mpg
MLRRIENRTARAVVRGGAKLASMLGLEVRQDRDGADRYFIQTWKGHNHYILSHRKKKYRTGIKKAQSKHEKYAKANPYMYQLSDFKSDTFNEYHLGFMSFYREVGNRYMHDIPQREEG